MIFIMIYITLKISLLLKITRILKRFLRSIIDFYFRIKLILNQFFSQHIMMENSRSEGAENVEDKIIKDVRNFIRVNKQVKETNNAAIKGIRIF